MAERRIPLTKNDQSHGPGAVGAVVRPIYESYQVSAFGELRVSQPHTLVDIVQKYGRDPRAISVSTNGGGDVSDHSEISGFRLTVGATAGDYAKARTNTWFRYQTGRGQHVILTVVHSDAGQANQARNWGYFDDNDGLMFRLSGTALSVVRRTSTGEGGGSLGSPYELTVPATAWNVDKMDGTGPSKMALDVTKGSIYEIRFQWLGVGVVQFFVNGYLVHQMNHPNLLSYPYMRTATLPLTWEVINSGAATAGYMNVICGHVTSQSGQEPPLWGMSATSNVVTTANANEIPILSLRLKQTLNGVDNRIVALPAEMSVENQSSNPGTAFLRLNPTLTGAAYVSADAASGVEYDVSATALTGGIVLSRVTLPPNDGRNVDLSKIFKENARKARRDAYTGVSDVLTLSIQRLATPATNPSIAGTLFWNEVR